MSSSSSTLVATNASSTQLLKLTEVLLVNIFLRTSHKEAACCRSTWPSLRQLLGTNNFWKAHLVTKAFWSDVDPDNEYSIVDLNDDGDLTITIFFDGFWLVIPPARPIEEMELLLPGLQE